MQAQYKSQNMRYFFITATQTTHMYKESIACCFNSFWECEQCRTKSEMYDIKLEALWATQHNISYFLLCHSRAAASDFRGSWSAALFALTLLNKHKHVRQTVGEQEKNI